MSNQPQTQAQSQHQATAPHKVYSHHECASHHPTALNQVRAVYEHAIEYTTMPKSVRGVVFLLATFMVSGVCFFMCWLLGSGLLKVWRRPDWHFDYPDYFIVIPGFITFLFAGIASMIWYGRKDFFRPLDLPILFDRQRRKVYWLDQWPPGGLMGMFKHWPIRYTECDWDTLVPEHHVSTYTTGTSAHQQHSLGLMVPHTSPEAAAQSDTPFADGFMLGNPMTLSELTTPAIWEHLRRYMNEGGPPLPPGESVCDTQPPTTLWESLGAVSVFGQGYLTHWKIQPFMTGFMHLLSPLFLPLAILMACTNWLSYKTAFTAKWPMGMRARVGFARDPQSLHTPRPEPEPQPPIKVGEKH